MLRGITAAVLFSAVLAVALTVSAVRPGRSSAEGLLTPPQISGESAVVLDGSNGDILFEKNSHMRVAPASLTKIATAIVAIENADLQQRLVIDFDSYQMVVDTESTVMGLKPGDNRSIEDLLYGLMLPSGNDAAVVIARTVGGSEAKFVEMMNDKVRALGLQDTHFRNPHGLDAEGHYSSAYDMAALSLYGMRHSVFRSLSATKKYEIRGNRPYELWNLNRLLYSYDGADGVKIGYTESALETIVASATRDGQKLIVAVMRSNSRYADARLLLDYYFDALKEGRITRIPAPTQTPIPTVAPLAAEPTPYSSAGPVSEQEPGSVSKAENPGFITLISDAISRLWDGLRGLLSFLGL